MLSRFPIGKAVKLWYDRIQNTDEKEGETDIMETRKQTIEEFAAELSSKAPDVGSGRGAGKRSGADGSQPDYWKEKVCGSGR